jgi:hypothetical protein
VAPVRGKSAVRWTVGAMVSMRAGTTPTRSVLLGGVVFGCFVGSKTIVGRAILPLRNIQVRFKCKWIGAGVHDERQVFLDVGSHLVHLIVLRSDKRRSLSYRGHSPEGCRDHDPQWPTWLCECCFASMILLERHRSHTRMDPTAHWNNVGSPSRTQNAPDQLVRGVPLLLCCTGLEPVVLHLTAGSPVARCRGSLRQ